MRKKRKKFTLKYLLILIVFLIGYHFFPQYYEDSFNLVSQKVTQVKVTQFSNNEIEEKKTIFNENEIMAEDIKLEFCPSNECFSLFADTINRAQEEIRCALYELDNNELAEILVERESSGVHVELLVDNGYLEEDAMSIVYESDIPVYSDEKRGTRYNNYMHNKFCVIDNKTIITGSANPTENGFFKNNNNIMVFESELLAINYRNEFEQMKSGKFGLNKKNVNEYENIVLQFENETYVVSAYFCPQNFCLDNVRNEIESAKEEVLFAAFVITHSAITESLLKIDKAKIPVKGLLETRHRNTQGSQYERLNSFANIRLDSNKNNMHNKFFIIDNKTVLTGSMNPSGSGVRYNDENLIIIRNEKIANMFREEFYKMYLDANN